MLEERPSWFLYPQAALFLVCIYVTGTRLGFSTNRNDLISAEDRHRRNYLAFQQEFRMRDTLVAEIGRAHV